MKNSRFRCQQVIFVTCLPSTRPPNNCWTYDNLSCMVWTCLCSKLNLIFGEKVPSEFLHDMMIIKLLSFNKCDGILPTTISPVSTLAHFTPFAVNRVVTLQAIIWSGSREYTKKWFMNRYYSIQCVTAEKMFFPRKTGAHKTDLCKCLGRWKRDKKTSEYPANRKHTRDVRAHDVIPVLRHSQHNQYSLVWVLRSPPSSRNKGEKKK